MKWNRTFTRNWSENLGKIEELFRPEIINFLTFFLVSFTILFLITSNHIWTIPIVFLIALTLLISLKNFFRTLFYILILIFLFMIRNYIYNQILLLNHNTYWVLEINDKGYTIINSFNIKFFLINNNNIEKLMIFEKINLEGMIKNNVFTEITKLRIMNNWDPRYYIFNLMINWDKIYKNFIFPILYGVNINYENHIFKNASNSGIIHLLIISGLHFQILFLFLQKVFKRKLIWITYSILFLYWLMCFKTVSVNRAFITVFVKFILSKWVKDQKTQFLFIFGFTILITGNLDIFKPGYWLSFVLYLIVSSSDNNVNWKSIFINYFVFWCISTSIQLFWKNEIYVISWCVSIFVTPLFEF